MFSQRWILTAGLVLSFVAPAWIAPPRVDADGFALPENVSQRLGSLLFCHEENTTFVHILPDNRTILSADGSQRAYLWEARTGKLLRSFSLKWPDVLLAGPPIPIWGKGIPRPGEDAEKTLTFDDKWRQSLAVSGDGKYLAGIITPLDGVRIWDIDTGKSIQCLLEPREAVRHLAFAPDGKSVATITAYGGVVLWDVKTGKPMKRWDTNQKDGPTLDRYYQPLAFTPNGRYLLWRDVSKGLKAVDLQGDAKVIAVSGPFKPDNLALTISPDSKEVVIVTGKSELSFLRIPDGKVLRRCTFANAEMDSRACLHPDGKTVFSASPYASSIAIYDLQADKERQSLPLGRERRWWRDHEFCTVSLSIAKDGQLLACAEEGRRLGVFDLATGKRLPAPVGHLAPVETLRFLPDGKRLLSACAADKLYRWDLATGKADLVHHPDKERSASLFSPDGRYCLSLNAHSVTTWAVETTQVRHKLKEKIPAGDYGLAFSADGTRIAVRHTKGGVELYSPGTGTLDRKLNDAEDWQRGVLALSGRGELLVQTSGSSLQIWNCDKGEKTLEKEYPLAYYASSALFTHDMRSVLVATWDDEIGIVEIATGRERCPINHLATPRAILPFAFVLAKDGDTWCRNRSSQLALSPDGSLIAHARRNGVIDLWEIPGRTKLGDLKGGQGSIHSIAFSPDGKRLAAGGGDGTVLVWDLAFLDKKRSPRDGKLSDKALDEAWKTLSSGDAEAAFAAMHLLLSASPQAMEQARTKLKPITLNEKQLRQWIAGLDDKQYAVRKQAYEELERLGELVKAELRQALKNATSAEQKKSLGDLLAARTGDALNAERLLQLRGVELLERMGTAEAKALLRELADGYKEARLTREAKAALDRLAK